MAKPAVKTTKKVEKEDAAPKSTGRNIVTLDQNLADYDEFEPLPPGRYKAQIRSAEVRISDKGNEYFYIVWNVPTDEYPPDYDVANAPEGMNLVYARLMMPTAANRRSIGPFKRFLATLGESTEQSSFDCNDWVGKEAVLTLKKGEFNDQPNNEIAAIEAEE